MAAKENLTKTADIQSTARVIDFVTRFARNWEHLREILGIMRPIRKEPGSVLKSKTATVVLQSGTVGEGEEIPYSKATVTETPYEEMTVEKYAKAVSIEAIKTYGYDVAVGMTDDAFLYELQDNVTRRFYTYLNTGTLTSSETTWQRALAMAKGRVINKFKQIHRTVTNVVGFANVLDLYDYLGDKDITVQTAFGFQYVQNFMGFSTVFLLSDEEIQRGRVIATPVENIVLYYVDPSTSDFARAGLQYTTDGETNLIGFHVEGNYHTAVSESFAIMGMTLFAEYKDAIAVIDVDDTPTLGTLTVSSAAGTEPGTTKLTVTPGKESTGNVYKYKTDPTTAPTVAYGQNVRTWTSWDGTSDITATTGHKITVVEADGTYKAQNAGNATVTAQT
nr:MAG TPA_asm: major capsid protein [Caudoviricetes sp.]